ncbi:N-acetylmuramoyl-L-alanine amidase [Streptococcus parasuis]|uniref:peptidoglycan recognition protein family protein n=1 Tax=Streptococcus parasuis TaxID=1501662 RepID=UPI0025A52B3F|nr:N-acetylmuramoyl-L-alanine amidase [Streptococcus parasuis]WJQ86083.1 N-acetylmuramoyl-L-alanine amidase [Streptococcus parasuis]
MSNLDLKMVQMLVPVAKYDIKCPYAMVPEFLTIHNTGNDASALAEISYMIGNGDEVSYHWATDDVQAIQGIEHNRNGWHSGDGGNGTGNRKSIGIEICHSLTPGNPKYAKSEDNGAKLAAIILHQYGWGIDRIRKHQDWSGKYCPHRILDNRNWEGFKGKVQKYLDELKNGTATQVKEKKEEEEDMITISAEGRGIALVMGGRFLPILDAKTPTVFWEQGVKHYQLDTKTFDAWQGKADKSTLDDTTVNKLIAGLK